jgi:hypothetical protein
MEWRYAGCSIIERFAGKVCQNTSARIMIHCIGSTNGKPIFEYDPYSYDKEKREAIEAWSRRLQIIVSGLRKVSADSATAPK